MIEKLKNGKPSSASIRFLIGVTVTSIVFLGNWLGYKPPVSSGHNPNSSAQQVILPPAGLDEQLKTAGWQSTHPPRPTGGVLAGGAASAFHPPAKFGQVSLGFERNQGQADPKVNYLTRGKGYALFLNQHDITLTVSKSSAPAHHQPGETPTQESSSPAIIRMELAGSQPAVKITGEHPRSEQINYLTGNDPRAWRREVPSYDQVHYTGIYPGIDAVYYGADHQLEYDFVVSPGASPKSIRMRFSGIEQAELDSEGNLVLSIENGKLVQTKPVVYQEILGIRHPVAGSYRLLAHNEIGFEVPVYDQTKPLVIDPILQYSSFLGGDETEAGYRIAVSPAGNAYVVGSTLSASFGSQSPTSVGLSGNRDVFVAKLNPTGTGLEYLTFLGGSAADFGHSLVVDSLGQVTVAGITESTDFPVQNARQAMSAGDADGFVARLNAAGTALVYSSYFGGSRGDVINAVTIDTQGAIYLTGSTESEDFPTQGPMQIQMGGRRDAFVTKLNPANPPQTQLVYSAFVGGSDMEVGLAIAVHSGNVYLAGSTRSANFPTVTPLQPTYGGSNGYYGDAFVVAINSSGTQVLSSTYLGGEGEDVATGIAVLNGLGNVIITGQTKSVSFPLKNAFQSTLRGESDGFVARLFESRLLTYASYLGGDGDEVYNGIASAGPDHYYITGQTTSALYPGADPVDPLERGSDLVVVHVGETGATSLPGIRDVTRYGGSGNDASESIAVDGSGNIYLGGRTRSANFPVLGPVQDTFGGGTQDAFVMKYQPCNTLTLSPATLSPATFESSYFQQFTVSGGAAPYRFLITYGGLPAGMTLTEDGSLSGVPVQPGEFLFTVTATDQAGCNTSRTYGFIVTCGNFTVTPDSLPFGAVNNTYIQTLNVTGGVEPYTFGLKSGTVPPGMTLSPDGTLAGTPTVVGNYPFTIRVTDTRGCLADKALNLAVAACPTFTFEPSGGGYLMAPPGVPFSQTIVVTGGSTPVTFSLAPGSSLPTGLTLSPTGTISGIPQGSGGYTFTIKITDGNGCTASRQYSIALNCQSFSILPDLPYLPVGEVNQPYSQVFSSTSQFPVTFAASPNQPLPTGLQLTLDGTLSGIPTQVGYFPIQILATESSGCVEIRNYSLYIECPSRTMLPARLLVTSLTAGVPFDQVFTVDGDGGPYTFAAYPTYEVSFNLPPGLELSPDGVWSGIPTGTGFYSVDIEATDPIGCRAQATYELTIECPTGVLGPETLANGVVGQPYSQTFTVESNGSGWRLILASGSLPEGVILSESGELAGTPTQAGSFSFTVSAQFGEADCFVSREYQLQIDCASIEITPEQLPQPILFEPYNQTLSATGGAAPYTWTISAGYLPYGLQLTQDGIMTGTPQQAGSYTITVRVQDAGYCTTEREYTVTVGGCPTITIGPETLPAGSPDEPYAQTLTTEGITDLENRYFEISSGELPPGLELLYTGELIGTPTQAGSSTFTVTVYDVAQCMGMREYTLTIGGCASLNLLPTTLPEGTIGTGYRQLATAEGGTAPYSFSLISGALPPGIELSGEGLLSGTPMIPGTYTFTVQATDAEGCTGSREWTATILQSCPTINLTPGLSAGLVGVAYQQTLSANGGTSPYRFILTEGVLPAGMNLSESGELNGLPQAAGTFSLVIQATDGSGCQGSQPYELTIGECPTIRLTPETLIAGQVQVGYTQTVTATGGQAPYRFSLLQGGLPAGLGLTEAGQLAGIPLNAGTFGIEIGVTDAQGCRQSRLYSLIIAAACPTLSITPATLAEGRVGVSFNQTLTATGGASPYSFTLSSGVPAGLSLSPTGVLTGTPETAGNFNLTLEVADVNGCTGSQVVTLVILPACPTLSITPATLAEGRVGSSFNQTLSASGGTAPYTFQVMTGSLPSGLTLSESGSLTGTPTTAGTTSFTLQVTDASGCQGTQTYTLEIKEVCDGVTISLTPTSLPDGTQGTAYSQILSANGGQSPYTFAVTSGTLPAGFTLSSTGELTSSNPVAGTTTLTVTATDARGCQGSQAYTLTVVDPCAGVNLVVTPAQLAEGRVGVAYTQTLTAQGGNAPYSFTAVSGVPAGLSLSPAGVLTGAPESAGNFNLTVEVTDATGCSNSQVIALTVLPACPTLSITPTTLGNGFVGISYSQILTVSGGIAPYTFQVTTGTLPSGLTLSSTGNLTGIPQANGSTTFTVTVQDAAGCQGSQSYTLTIGNCPTLSVVPGELPAGSEGTPYSVALTAPGGVAPITFNLFSGVLPTGITLTSAGVLTGATTASGSFAFTVKMVDASGCQGTQSLTLTIGTCPTIAVGPTALPAGMVDVAYNQQLEVSGGTAPHQFNLVTGSLPDGLTLSDTGLVSGIPVGTGSTTFTVAVTDAGGCRGQQTLTLTIGTCPPVTFLPPMLPPGLVNEAYDQLVTVVGTTGPVTVELVSGTLPTGLELTPAGRIFGTPTAVETATVVLKATDGTGCSGIQTFTLRIKPVCSTQTIGMSPATLSVAKLGVAYEQTLSATGGEVPYAFTVSAGSLPAGLGLSPTGRLFGTPTTLGTTSFTITVMDADTCTTTQNYTLTVEEVCAGVSITLTPSTLANGIQGTAYSQTLSASGGQGPYTFTVSSGTLPAGLTLTSTGELTGTPTTAGTATFTVTVTDAGGCVGSQSYSLTVGDPCAGVSIVLTPAQVAGGRVGSAYSQAITARNGVEPYSFTLSAGTLPPGINLSSTGILTGTPGTAGDFPVTILATDANGCRGSRSYTLRIVEICAGVTIGLSPETLPNGAVGSGYSQLLTATGGQTPYTFAITSGGLPAGLTLNPNGTLSGTPTTAGTATFSITATDGNGCTGVRSYSITVSAPANITIQPETIPGGTVGVPYSQTLTATGGTGPYTFTVTGGALPTGLTLSTTGVISGTPTTAGEFTVTVTATDANGATGTRTYTSVRYGDALIRHAPTLNGRLEGSLQMLLGESLTLNGGAVVTGKLLVPGTPTVRTNGNPTFGGVIVGTGSPQPSNYTVTLNGNCTLGNLVNRMDPLALPTVANPPNPTGTRDVTISQASQSIGDPATLRNLTLNGNVGMKAVPPGTYGTFIANGGSGFIFGVAGASEPTVYNLQNLNLNGNSQIQIVGPVVLTLRNGTSINSSMGNTTNPQWLQLRIATNGFTLNGGSSFYGAVLAPNGTVIVNGNSTLRGSVAADRLTINGGGLLRPGNQ